MTLAGDVREAIEAAEDEPYAVHEALAAVLDALGPIPKNGEAPASMGGYKFRRVEDITAALKPLFAKHGLLCVPSVMTRVESQRTTGNNKILYCVDLEICFRFVGPQGDELATNVWGQGTDSGDKATQKAVTSAFKTMLSVVFCISDSEMDAEAHDVPETARRVPAAKDRIERCKQLIIERDLTDWIRRQGYAWPWTDEECGFIELYAQNQPDPDAVDPDETVAVPVVEPMMSRAESQAKEAARPIEDYSSEPF